MNIKNTLWIVAAGAPLLTGMLANAQSVEERKEN